MAVKKLAGPVVLEGDVKVAAELMIQAIVHKQEELGTAQDTMLQTVFILLGLDPRAAKNASVSSVDGVITIQPKPPEILPAVQPEPRK